MPIGKAILLLSCTLLMLISCSTNVADGGSGTQTTNGICVVSHNGTLSGYVFAIDPADGSREIPVAAVPVSLRLFGADYHPFDKSGFGATPVIDSAGSFTCDSLQSGRYNMFAYDTSAGVGIFIGDIPVGDSAGDYSAQKRFAPWRMVRGVIHNASAMPADYRGGYIAGTPFFALADSIGVFSFMRVPVGTYTIKADYFTVSHVRSQDSVYLRTKGFLRTVDTLVIYTDSINVDIRSDTPVHRVELSL